MVADPEVLALVDRAALAAYLATVTTVEVSVLSGGRSNLTYLVCAGSRELVVRRLLRHVLFDQIYVEHPVLAQQDAKPYGALRKWARQFYDLEAAA